MKINIKSTLEKIANQVFTAKTADEAKQIIVSHISDSQVNDIDKNKQDIINIRKEIDNMKNDIDAKFNKIFNILSGPNYLNY